MLKVTKESNENTDQQTLLYSNTDISEIYLNKNKTSYVGDFVIAMGKQFHKRWDNVLQALQKNKPLEYDAEVGDSDSMSIFSPQSLFDRNKSDQSVQQMQMFTHTICGVSVGLTMVLYKVFFSNHKKMMDVGGGSGVYAIEIVKGNPHMFAIVLDLESACQVANKISCNST